jgi:hypothetical protein
MTSPDRPTLDYAGPRTNARKSAYPVAIRLITSGIFAALGFAVIRSNHSFIAAIYFLLSIGLLLRGWRRRDE